MCMQAIHFGIFNALLIEQIKISSEILKQNVPNYQKRLSPQHQECQWLPYLSSFYTTGLKCLKC
jgi:hypothetical protein